MEILSREDELKTRTITAQELFEILDNEVCEIDKELKQLQKAVAEYWKK